MPTRVQAFNNISAGAVASLSTTLGSAVSVGDLIVCGVLYGDDATTASINDATNGAGKDSLNNSYTNAGSVDLTTAGDLLYVFYSVATHAGTPTIRVVASSGTHNIKIVGETVTPTNAFTLDQAITSHYDLSTTTPTAGTQTPTSASGYAFNAYGAISGMAFSHDVAWNFAGAGQSETSDTWLLFQDLIYTSTTALTPAPTLGAAREVAGVMALFKDAASGGGGGGLTVDEGEYAPPVPQPLETTILIF